MRKLLSAVGILVCVSLHAQCPDGTQAGYIKIADKVRQAVTTNYWDDWSSVPFTILAITDEQEYVLHEIAEDTSFRFGCDSIQYRERSFDKRLLATFQFINQKPTIVVGTPENTGKSPEAWIVTLLHEHFHQFQFGHPHYYASQKELGLAKGDQTGMWMLNHPFPYEQPEIVRTVRDISNNLLRIYEPHPVYDEILKEHKQLKRKLEAISGKEHYTYLNLQLWQEGFSRFVEMQLLEDWIEGFDHIDQEEFSRERLLRLLEEYHGRIKNDLASGDLPAMKRSYFYSLGAAEAMLIAQTNPNWRASYFDQLYTTDHLLLSE